jgi:hypothetical protein
MVAFSAYFRRPLKAYKAKKLSKLYKKNIIESHSHMHMFEQYKLYLESPLGGEKSVGVINTTMMHLDIFLNYTYSMVHAHEMQLPRDQAESWIGELASTHYAIIKDFNTYLSEDKGYKYTTIKNFFFEIKELFR